MKSGRVSIALATYNGARFLGEQLDSLGRQEILPHELVVVDDGSTDDTLRVVRSFARKAPFPVNIYSNDENLGYGETFMKAASLCEGEWIAFCDQDDVWMPEKIRRIKTIIEKNPALNVVVHDAFVCDAELHPRRSLLMKSRQHNFFRERQLSAAQCTFRIYFGCCTVVKRAFLLDIPPDMRPKLRSGPEVGRLVPHDIWVFILGDIYGSVYLSPLPLLLYRRHQKTTTGHTKKKIRRQLAEVRKGSSNDYRRLGIFYTSLAEGLCQVAASVNVRQSVSMILDSTHRYEQAAGWSLQRALLYEAASVWKRLSMLVKLWNSGCYFGTDRMKGFGTRALVKDFLRVWLGGS